MSASNGLALRRIINNSPTEFRFEKLFVFNAGANTFILEQNMVLILGLTTLFHLSLNQNELF
jgi:hypothetical protein